MCWRLLTGCAVLKIIIYKNNAGISFLPTFTVQDELKSGELVEIETELSDIQISAVCGYHKNKWISPAMDCFTKLLKNDS